MHVGNGMYGLILVEPKEGLPAVAREYYVMQGDFYTTGKYGAEGLQTFDLEKATDERPTYVVFNGSVGALVGDKAITAKVGETVRLYVGNGGPNLLSSFHVIGEIFDLVYPEGGTLAAQKNVQTTLVPAGGSTIVEFKVEVPGTFILVDHSLSRAFNKGALGMLKVAGPENCCLFRQGSRCGPFGRQAEAGSEFDKCVAALQAQMKEAFTVRPKDRRFHHDIQTLAGKGVFTNLFRLPSSGWQGLPGQIRRWPSRIDERQRRSIRAVLQGLSVNHRERQDLQRPDGSLNYLRRGHRQRLTYVRNSLAIRVTRERHGSASHPQRSPAAGRQPVRVAPAWARIPFHGTPHNTSTGSRVGVRPVLSSPLHAEPIALCQAGWRACPQAFMPRLPAKRKVRLCQNLALDVYPVSNAGASFRPRNPRRRRSQVKRPLPTRTTSNTGPATNWPCRHPTPR
jgi:hypothetical protein